MRRSKHDSSGTYSFLTDGAGAASPVLYDGSAAYSWGAGLVSERRSSSSDWYLSDQLGTPEELLNASQTVTDTFHFDAFGNATSRTGTTNTPFGYAGGFGYQQDKDSGLKLLGHRYYDASIGRFISQDPIQAGTNWYAYVDNSPLSFVDPEGYLKVNVGYGGDIAGGLAGNAETGIVIDLHWPPQDSTVAGYGQLGGGIGGPFYIGVAPTFGFDLGNSPITRGHSDGGRMMVDLSAGVPIACFTINSDDTSNIVGGSFTPPLMPGALGGGFSVSGTGTRTWTTDPLPVRDIPGALWRKIWPGIIQLIC